ncbi:unnamed protein product (macronuclear) [Paramecium tetraurelia]|uniref:Fungal lipase-type domain-containing protein n=1 Tax=Paramecium tetraurelia TaxID=5888 RepID=A0DZI5_PARTE|nr:uncharacterized protein GSPATT00021619001 [Paramecium tetraurelia]CAK88452.1 unnamed protein product [Paramecium tetraurelia]|eukprot:XP_001455849.1 hypothetical protein (macronuclear) [Paramecium tetraurelia strain d4-2]
MTSSRILLLVLVATASAFTYNEAIAKENAALSFASYCPNAAIHNWSVGYVSKSYPDLTNIEVFENLVSGTKGYIAYNKKESAIVVVFRGSSNIQNWIENISFGKTEYNKACKCKVHTGFHDAFVSLKPKLDSLFPGYATKYPYAAIHVTGHSLGGAMATLYALELAEAGRTVGLFTYGSPRVGDPDFYDWFTKYTKITHFRVVNQNDTVPHLPLYAMGFYHQDREIWYHDGTHTVCAATRGEDKTCSYTVKSTSNADHSTYIGLSSSVDC